MMHSPKRATSKTTSTSQVASPKGQACDQRAAKGNLEGPPYLQHVSSSNSRNDPNYKNNEHG
ncbi:MAG: hypothetical protein EBR13_01725 [Rhodobacteraceae bacterium]|nr:hypothetical protein [Paracoccaceae bacterium]